MIGLAIGLASILSCRRSCPRTTSLFVVASSVRTANSSRLRRSASCLLASAFNSLFSSLSRSSSCRLRIAALLPFSTSLSSRRICIWLRNAEFGSLCEHRFALRKHSKQWNTLWRSLNSITILQSRYPFSQ